MSRGVDLTKYGQLEELDILNYGAERELSKLISSLFDKMHPDKRNFSRIQTVMKDRQAPWIAKAERDKLQDEAKEFQEEIKNMRAIAGSDGSEESGVLYIFNKKKNKNSRGTED